MNVTSAIAMDTLLLIALGRPLNVIFVKPVLNQVTYIRTTQKTDAINVNNMDICSQMIQKLENQSFECSCDPQAVNAQRLFHYTQL